MALAARAPASSPGPVPWAVEVTDLTFYIAPVAPEPALQNCSIQLPRGARCLLLGPNGAGKSTLLRLLAGKRMCKEGAVHVFGLNPFHHTPKETVSFLGTEWASNRIVVESDIVVSEFLDSVGGWRHAARRDRLLDLLDIDTTWHMNSISDGERRRVQLCMGLMAPFDLLLLDEVTVDLDVQVRQDLLDFLVQETKERNATIVYATHIFDGLGDFPTHVVHMRMGETVPANGLRWPPTAESAELLPAGVAIPADVSSDTSLLFRIALAWLREDKKLRLAQEREHHGQLRRGAQLYADQTEGSKFFGMYDYSKDAVR